MAAAAAPAGDTGEFVPHIPFEEFRNGLPHGRFRVVVDPKRARAYVKQRLFLIGIVTPLIGIGIALAISGQPWPGAALVALAVALGRFVRAQAPKMVLHMAARDAKVYDDVTQHGVMEVRRAAD